MDPSYTHYGPGLRLDQSSRKVAEPLLPPAPPHATVKQNILNSFANDVLAKGGQDLLDEFQSMKLAFDQHARGSNSYSVMFRLLKNEDGAGLQALFERASVARNNWVHHKQTT